MIKTARVVSLGCILTASVSLACGTALENRTVQMMASQKKQPPQQGTLSGSSPTPSISSKKVKVYKPDGSLQCGMARGIALEEMAKEFQDITIYSSQKKMDGLVRIAQCGTPTGMCNVYEIERAFLPRVIEMGFKEWTFEGSP